MFSDIQDVLKQVCVEPTRRSARRRRQKWVESRLLSTGQTDGRTDTRPLHRPYIAHNADSVNKRMIHQATAGRGILTIRSPTGILNLDILRFVGFDFESLSLMLYCVRAPYLVTDDSSGPSRAIDLLCVSSGRILD